MSIRSRGVSPVLSTILMAAIVVVLAGAASLYVFDIGEELRNPAPNVAESSGELIQQSGFNGGKIRITHEAGDTVATGETEIVVDASDACGKRERLINLPEDDSNNAGRFADTNVQSGSISGSIISGGSATELGVLDSRTTNQFTAGSFLQFRLTAGDCSLDSEDVVAVRVVHTPSNSVIITEQLTV